MVGKRLFFKGMECTDKGCSQVDECQQQIVATNQAARNPNKQSWHMSVCHYSQRGLLKGEIGSY